MTANDAENGITPRAWLVMLGAFTCLFSTVGFMNAFGVFQEFYTRDQLASHSAPTIAWIGAISMFCLFSISAAAGAMLDAFGPKIMVCSGSFGIVFSLMMTSVCEEFWQFTLAQGILLGVSMALTTWPMVALVGQYVKTHRAAAMGFVISGSSLGGIVWPIVVDRLIKTPSIGFPWTMRIIGFIMIPCLAFSCAVAKSPRAGAKTSEKAGIEREEKATTTDSAPKQFDQKAAAKALFRKPSMQLTCLATFILYFGMFSPHFYVTSYAVEQGFSTSLAFYTVSIVNGASFFGRILPGFVADRYGRFNCMIAATLLSGIIAMCWVKVTSVAGLVIWSATYGFTSGGILSLQQSCAVQLATPSTMGLAIGTVSSSQAFSAMANVPISGALAARYGYLALSMFSGVSLLLGGLSLTAARLAQDRRLRAVI